MLCFICLKNGNKDNIDFDKLEEAAKLEIKTVIEKHLWLKLNDAPPTCRTICTTCWNCLLSFHKFYLSVESAHKALTETLISVPLKDCSFETSIDDGAAFLLENGVAQESHSNEAKCCEKQQENTEENTNTAPIKRKRGRPRRQPLTEPTAEKSPKIEVVIDQINLNEIKIELPEADLTIADVLDDDAVLDDDVADLMQQDDSSDVSTVGNQTSRGKKKTKEYDEFIALNFQLNCTLCNSNFHNFTALTSHCRKEHKIRGYAKCCNKKFYKRGTLVDHLHCHQNPEYFKCQTCENTFSDRRGLEKHMSMHGAKTLERNYKCNVCSKSFYSLAVTKRHQLTHLTEEQKTVQCTQCDKTFPTQYIMKQHVRIVHLNLYAKICDMCGKSIRNREAYERHMAQHTGMECRLLQCDICGINLTTKYGLRRHMKMMHDEENRQPIKCPHCTKISSSLAAHKYHVKFMHNMQRKHQCPMCDKAFKRNIELREHLTTHTGEVLYTCPHCPKTFNSSANMHSHRKKMHFTEWEAQRRQRHKNPGQSKDTASIIAISQQKTIEQQQTSLKSDASGEI